jgi:hypothetical protein
MRAGTLIKACQKFFAAGTVQKILHAAGKNTGDGLRKNK